ncbi:UNVERIFIED_CONTAM: Aspartic proteinase NANA, chloroplast [Sesamum latifolium]|uniref:Aspartic proteinase NANA, chloroplast n=1 Tax=Sesamum latifolium TaxID=2727402 RepID=A0AAW2WQ44_9LAMI
MRYTELLLGVITPFYAVKIKGISIGGLMLDIPPETWNLTGQGGAIIDSGSSLTGLTQKAYQPVMAALQLSLLNFKNLNLDIGPLEYCFNSTGFDESMVPRLVFHFEDGASFKPPVKSYVIDAAPGVKCLGFVSLPWPGASVIGNIMQQNHLWEFDLANGRLGFATSSCI